MLQPRIKRKVICTLNYAVYHESIWGVGIQLHIFLISALNGGKQLASHHSHFTQLTNKDWVGSRNGTNVVKRRNIFLLARNGNPALL
jgi:hypothetical protein